MNDPIKQFTQLRVSLTAEKQKLEARLALLNEALGANAPTSAITQTPRGLSSRSTASKHPISDATRAKMRAAQQRRWAKVHGTGATPALPVAQKPTGTAKAKTRPHNTLSLHEAIRQVIKAKPMDRKEILVALAKIGYKTNSSNPMNLLSSVLYRKGAGFRSKNGKFSAA